MNEIPVGLLSGSDHRNNGINHVFEVHGWPPCQHIAGCLNPFVHIRVVELVPLEFALIRLVACSTNEILDTSGRLAMRKLCSKSIRSDCVETIGPKYTHQIDHALSHWPDCHMRCTRKIQTRDYVHKLALSCTGDAVMPAE